MTGTISSCRACDSPSLAPVLSLGPMPLANALVSDPSAEDLRFPLDLVRCPVCSLVQITETVDPEVLFRDYTYFSSFSDTFVEHARAYAARLVDELGLGPDSFVVEAASNDGYLLQFFVGAGVPVLGVEPARNVAEAAQSRGVDTVSEFLGPEVARSIVDRHGEANLVVANNVTAHVADLHGFVASLGLLAGATGVISIEIPYVCDLIDRLEFDTIYHEHLCYFSLTSLSRLLEGHGLRVVDVERLPVHGGSLRVFASADGREPTSVVGELVEGESAWGIEDPRRYDTFAREVETLRVSIREFVADLVTGGARVAAYGAAAKGVVLANYCNLGSGLVDFVVDRNPHKQGKLLPGVRIPIETPESLVERAPEYCLLFAWNLADEIVAQQIEYRERGGRFVVPVPAPRVIDGRRMPAAGRMKP